MQTYQLPRPLAAIAAKLTPRSGGALAVVALSFFLMVCVARFGADAHVNVQAARSAGAVARLSAWMVVNAGAGIWALLVLPMAWGAIVYFNERTPDLLLRFAGTVLLAVSTSALVGLKDPGSVWAGHVGRAASHAVGGLSVPLGGFGTVLAWAIVLALFGVSGLFATDWMFHTLRRGGAPAEKPAAEIATEPPAALLDDPADAEPRGFIADAPRVPETVPATAAAPADPQEPEADLDFALESEDDYEIHTSLDVRTPEGWDETVEDGRRIIAAPSGYRGVEFLPPSDELATPEVLRREMPQIEPQPARFDAVPAAFHDDEFVATRDAAFFVERVDPADAAAEPEEPVAAAEEPDEEIEEAVQALFEAVTAPEPAAAPASGISLPEDSPFLDEFFPGDAGWPFAAEAAAPPSDGASAASEMASDYAATAPVPAAAAPAPAPEPEPEPAFADDVLSIDEILVSRLPSEVFEDSIASAAEEPLSPAPRAPEPVSEPSYSSEPSFAETPERIEAVAVAVEEPVVEVAAPAYEPEPVAIAEVAEPAIEVPAAEPEFALPVAETIAEVAAEPVAEPVAAPAVEPAAESVAEPFVAAAAAPQLDLFASTLPATPVADAPAGTAPEPDLSRIHAMELDPLFRDAVVAVLDRGRASAVVLQRQLGIGYARGIRILDQMTALGLVGPDSPTGSRQLRITREKWDAFASA
jgi:DNA translocase FtsK/SpoIIIE-like protein